MGEIGDYLATLLIGEDNMAKSSGGSGRAGGYLRTKDYRSGRDFLIPQSNSSEQMRLRFNKSEGRYEYYKEDKFYKTSRYVPLSNISYAFNSNDYVESQLWTVRRQIHFADQQTQDAGGKRNGKE